MISEAERYQGTALRQIILSAGRPVSISVADTSGRVDSFSIERTGFQIKYSTKRLSPWNFSFTADQMFEVAGLARTFGSSVWMVLVCGVDGVVCLRAKEFLSITESRPGGVCSIRVYRNKKTMYRVCGNARELPAAKARGVDEMVAEAISQSIQKMAAQ
jgi:hypothetical protein